MARKKSSKKKKVPKAIKESFEGYMALGKK